MAPRPLRLPLLLLTTLLIFPSAVSAHRLDEYLQATLVAIEPDAVRLQINLMPGVDVAGQVLARIDADRDGMISANEETAYAEALKRDLILKLEGHSSELKLTACAFPEPSELRDGHGIIQIEFSAQPGLLTSGAHRLTLENAHLPAVSVYLFNAAKPESAFVQITAQKRNEDQSAGEIEFIFQPPPMPVNSSSGTAGIMVAFAALLVAVFAAAWRWRVRKRLVES